MGAFDGNAGRGLSNQQPSTSTHFQRVNVTRGSASSSSTSWSSAQSSPSQHPHTPQSQIPQHSHAQHQPANPSNHLPVPSSQGAEASSSNRSTRAGHSSFFCFGLLMVHSTFMTLVVFDLLLLSHSLIFTISNYLNGEKAYVGSDTKVDRNRGLVIAANNLPYTLLMPFFGVQVFWLIAAILALVSLKTVQPYWQLPYLMISGIVLFATMWLIIQTIQTLAISDTVDWALALTLSFSNVVFLVQIYFLYIKIVCIKALVRKRKLVVSKAISEVKIMCSSASKSKSNLTMPVDSCSNQSPRTTNRSKPQEEDTFSTQSTVVISDGNHPQTAPQTIS